MISNKSSVELVHDKPLLCKD